MTARHPSPLSQAHIRKRDHRCNPRRPAQSFARLLLAFLIILLSACAQIPRGVDSLSTLVNAPTPALTALTETPAVKPMRSSPIGNLSPIKASNMEITEPAEARRITPGPSLPPASPTPTRRLASQAVSDLLYISQDQLMRWDHATHYNGLLAEGVIAYSASADGHRIGLLRSRGMAANGVAAYDLDMLDLQSMQIEPLQQGITRPFHMTLSPDGKWLAYTMEEKQGPVFAMRTDLPNVTVQLGDCSPVEEGQCEELAWSPDSRALLWSESQGLWIAPVKEASSRLIQATKVTITDPKGQAVDIDVQFASLRWSPAGRFVLADVKPINSEVSWQAVLDTRSGRLSQMVDTFVSAEAGSPPVNESVILWLKDGSLLTASASDPSHQKPPILRTWHVLPTNPNLLVPARAYELYADDFPFSSTNSKAIPMHCVNWLAQQDDQRILLGIILADSGAAPVLYSLSLDNGRLQTLFQIPSEAISVLWSPDASGVLVAGSRGQMFYITAAEMLDLGPQLGPAPHAFTWLPPAPHK
jgi:hypothetical protein